MVRRATTTTIVMGVVGEGRIAAIAGSPSGDVTQAYESALSIVAQEGWSERVVDLFALTSGDPRRNLTLLFLSLFSRLGRESRSPRRWSSDRLPLFLQRVAARRAPRLPVPVSRIAGVALFAVQIRVHPCAIAALALLCHFVGAFPVALGVEPQCAQQRWEPRGRALLFEVFRAGFLVEVHERLAASRSGPGAMEPGRAISLRPSCFRRIGPVMSRAPRS